MSSRINYVYGDYIGYFMFVHDAEPSYTSAGRKVRFGIFICPRCGKEFRGNFSPIKNGSNKSCGCLNKSGECRVKHGLTGTRIMKIWTMMKIRCYTKTYDGYWRYGARGIRVCDEWLHDVAAFAEWANNHGYSTKLTLDRVDGDKGYCPENCRWATQTVQTRNRGINSNNNSGYKGVYLEGRSNKYVACITVDYKAIHLGRFDTALGGAIAYNTYVSANKLEHKLNDLHETERPTT